MRRTTRPFLLPHGGAVAFTAPAALLRWLPDLFLAWPQPFATLYGAVGLAATLGCLGCNLLSVEPRRAFCPGDAPNLLGPPVALLRFGMSVGFGEAMHAGRRLSEGPPRRPEQEAGRRGRAGRAAGGVRASTEDTLPELAPA
jgi:hypothetical protein